MSATIRTLRISAVQKPCISIVVELYESKLPPSYRRNRTSRLRLKPPPPPPQPPNQPRRAPRRMDMASNGMKLDEAVAGDDSDKSGNGTSREVYNERARAFVCDLQGGYAFYSARCAMIFVHAPTRPHTNICTSATSAHSRFSETQTTAKKTSWCEERPLCVR